MFVIIANAIARPKPLTGAERPEKEVMIVPVEGVLVGHPNGTNAVMVAAAIALLG